MTRTWEALNRFGATVRTFGTREQAAAYRDAMEALGSVITIRVRWAQQREIAA